MDEHRVPHNYTEIVMFVLLKNKDMKDRKRQDMQDRVQPLTETISGCCFDVVNELDGGSWRVVPSYCLLQIFASLCLCVEFFYHASAHQLSVAELILGVAKICQLLVVRDDDERLVVFFCKV